MTPKSYLKIIFTALVIGLIGSSCQKPQQVTWPEKTNETKPWTRWWWHGSAVNAGDLTANMEELEAAGFGGVEITPIYDVKGYEDQSLSFQSSEWMAMFEHTLKEGQRLGLGIDLANASGWPFGGPWIGAEHACKNVQFKSYSLKGGEKLNEKVQFIQPAAVRAVGHRVDISEVKFPISSNTNLQELALDQVQFEKPLPLQTLMAFNKNGEVLELTDKVDSDGTLNWEAPEGDWNLYAVFQGWHGKMVERAGTGGEGNVIDHFSEEAAKLFLADFDKNAKDIDLTGLRAFFNDSYEVDDARGDSNWTPLFFDEFKNRRGYDLKQYLPALFGNDTEENNKRVLCDYRETISDLLLDRFTKVWAGWAESHQAIIRNQAHGSPANILDLYEASHIPETEGTDPMRIKMATSAGHVSGKPLIACEAATWLDEHFLANLSAVKQNLDNYLANGVNHIVYHGTPYSPKAEEYPGWMFYAAVHFAPSNSWWNDLKEVNRYVTNCQSFMQNSTPNNDILLYFPIYDAWTERDRTILPHFGGHTEELTSQLSNHLIKSGYTFDYISDKQIGKLTCQNQSIFSGNVKYKTILIPATDYIPLETMQKLMALAEGGATIIFEKELPNDVSGLSDLAARQKEFQTLVKSLNFQTTGEVSSASHGSGKIVKSANVPELLNSENIYAESMADAGLWFNRVIRPEGTCYFISNWSGKTIDQWLTIQSSGKEAVLFDPMTEEMGKATVKKTSGIQSEVYLQLKPGETRILQWYSSAVEATDFPLWQTSNTSTDLKNEWEISFTKGVPSLPESYKTSELKSWTEESDELQKFSGTASYKTTFKKPAEDASTYVLNLGKVHESAVVILNGEKLGTLVGPDFQINIPGALLTENNELEIQVTNLMANSMIDLEKRGVQYKKFYNINFAAHERTNVGLDGTFTAMHWNPLESGLLGPVNLTALTKLSVELIKTK
ncbi:glycosyl hydrolase [Prolixibacteraceae bacterium Z1-6]|uniref:Glycosyl hydrolase n=1 Tax=Draconibacterium aestuarii TaxID=2998507 RepID=A0A9X3F9V6_9BACT|nr:glycosyl hydrolase [Prolixibacteraceae bacterium Z1-6]